jgi:hypothetical protein
MKKASIAVVLLLAVLAPGQPAFGWGSATHALIGHELRAQAGPVDLDEIYGSMAPDLFNFLFVTPYAPLSPYLYGVSHGDGAEVRAALRRGWEKAELYGFVGHNDLWGSDLTAHHASLTLSADEGYVITKARALHEILILVPEYAALGLPEAVSLEICHNLVESAGDLLVAAADPGLGAQMVAAAQRPAGPLQGLLARAWTDGLVAYAAGAGVTLTPEQAAGVIVGSEAWFRNRMISYGTLLQQEPAVAFEGVVLDFESLAEAYLAFLGVTLPPGTDLKPLIRYGLAQSTTLCAGDYFDEVAATVGLTGFELRSRRVLQKGR